MALKVLTSFDLLQLVILVVCLTVMPINAVYGVNATCDNEVRAENKKACEEQRFGELVSYPGNCSKFLVCNCKYPTVKQCPDGTWFDNKIQVCNFPQNVQCTKEVELTTPSLKTSTVAATTLESSKWGQDCAAPTGMSSEICLKYEQGFLLPYPYNCNAYINCTKGCPVMKYCQHGKVFNTLLKICDTPDTAQCKELPVPTSATSKTSTTQELSPDFTTADIPSTTEDNWITADNTTATTLQPNFCLTPIGVDVSICSYLYQDIYHIYPYNCSAYVKCQDDLACLEYCDQGKIFNSDLGICDEDIECLEKAVTTSTLTTESTTSGVTSSLPPHVDPALCQGKMDYTVYPYEENCGRYLLCESDEVKFKRCPEGWFFNSKLMLCDAAAADNQCASDINATTQDPVPTTTKTEAISDICLNQPAGKTFPNKENCQLYYYCRGNGQFYEISCPFENLYDRYSGNCGPNVQAEDCLEPKTSTLATTTELTTLSPAEKCANEIFAATYAYEENCSKYIFCKGNGKFIIMNCPYNNYYYTATGNCGPSNDQNICRKSSQTTSEVAATTLAVTPNPKPYYDICGNNFTGQLLPYPDNCEKYISCVRPIPMGFYCPNSWRFSEQQQKCLKDVEGTCVGLSTNRTISTNKPNDICRGHEAGSLQVNSDNCQLYYECVGNDNYMLKACNQGKYFDPVKRQCSALVSSGACWTYIEGTLAPSTVTPYTTQPPNICRHEVLGTKVSYPHNCSKYIKCEIPIPMGFNCAAGLQFSFEQQTCVKSSESNCETSIEHTTVGISTIPDTTKPLDRCSYRPDFTFSSYENDCSMFIICFQNKEHLAYCETGTFYDRTLEKCSAKGHEYSCLFNTTTEPSTTTTPNANMDPCFSKTDGTKIPYPDNCSKYIECNEPLNVGYDCPGGLEFSIQQQKCVSPDLADCSIKSSGTTENTIPAATTLPSTILPPSSPAWETCEHKATGSTLVYTPDCSKYYICINGKEKLTNCMPNCYYNPLAGECEYNISPYACTAVISTTASDPGISTTTAKAVQDLCNNQSNGFMFANKKNCSQYFICLRESSVKCICQNDAFYNPQTEECEQDMSANSNCQKVGTTTTETAYSTTAETMTSQIAPAETTTLTVLTSTTIETSRDNICCGQEPGKRLPYPSDQTKYVICKYPLPEIYACPEGRLYEVSSSSCISETLLM